MNKFIKDMMYVNNELSQEKYSIFLSLHFGIVVGVITIILYLNGNIYDMKDLLGYSSTIILASLGFKVGSGMLRDTNAQIFGSPRYTMPVREPKNKE